MFSQSAHTHTHTHTPTHTHNRKGSLTSETCLAECFLILQMDTKACQSQVEFYSFLEIVGFAWTEVMGHLENNYY